jgi:1-deoxy-D-xylulose-5-phosphate reductoisomerase
MSTVIEQLDLCKVGHLTFGEPDTTTFPLLAAAFDCMKAGGAMPAVLNAANEEVVAAFLEKKIGFTDIAPAVLATLEHFAGKTEWKSIDELLESDRQARLYATDIIRKYSQT